MLACFATIHEEFNPTFVKGGAMMLLLVCISWMILLGMIVIFILFRKQEQPCLSDAPESVVMVGVTQPILRADEEKVELVREASIGEASSEGPTETSTSEDLQFVSRPNGCVCFVFVGVEHVFFQRWTISSAIFFIWPCWPTTYRWCGACSSQECRVRPWTVAIGLRFSWHVHARRLKL